MCKLISTLKKKTSAGGEWSNNSQNPRMRGKSHLHHHHHTTTKCGVYVFDVIFLVQYSVCVVCVRQRESVVLNFLFSRERLWFKTDCNDRVHCFGQHWITKSRIKQLPVKKNHPPGSSQFCSFSRFKATTKHWI